MTTAQIIFTESEAQAIEAISQSEGKTPGEILHEAVEPFLARHQTDGRLAALRQARGIWQEQQDLPDPVELRKGRDRF